MTYDVSLFISLAAIAVMLVCLYLVLSLKSGVPGGLVGRKWRFLTALVVIFTAGYIATPFFDFLPAEAIRMIVSLIFLFGAIYVLITIRLVYTVIRELAG